MLRSAHPLHVAQHARFEAFLSIWRICAAIDGGTCKFSAADDKVKRLELPAPLTTHEASHFTMAAELEVALSAKGFDALGKVAGDNGMDLEVMPTVGQALGTTRQQPQPLLVVAS